MKRFIKLLLEIIAVGAFLYLLFVIKLFQNAAVNDWTIDRLFSRQNAIETLTVIAIATIAVLGFNWLRGKSHETSD